MYSLKKIGSIAAIGVAGAAAYALTIKTLTLDDVRQKIIEDPTVWKIVVGEDAKASDVIGAVEIGAALQYFAKEVEQGSADVKIIARKEIREVEEVPFYKDTVRLYLGDSLDKAVPKYLVQEGIVEGSEKEYHYKVYIKPSNSKIEFKNKPDAEEPTVLVEGPIFEVKVEFEAGSYLNISDVRGSPIEILGKKFYIDEDNRGNLVLRSLAKEITLEISKDTQQRVIEFGGKSIVLKGIVRKAGGKYAALFEIEGKREVIEEGEFKIVKGIKIYVKDIFTSVTEDKSWIVVMLSKEEDSITLIDGVGIEYNDKIYRDVVPHIDKSNNLIKSITFEIHVSEESEHNYVEVGKEFTPRLFDNLKFTIEKTQVGTEEISLVPEGYDEYSLKIGDIKVPLLYLEEKDGDVYLDFLELIKDGDKTSKFKGMINSTKDSPSTEFTVGEGDYFAILDTTSKESYLYKVKRIKEYDEYVDVELEGVFGKDITLERISKDNTNPTEVIIGSYTLKLYYDAPNEKLVFSNVDAADVSKTLELYTKESTKIKITDNNSDLTDGIDDHIKIEVYRKYPNLQPNDIKIVEISIKNETTDGKKYLDVQDYTIYHHDGTNADLYSRENIEIGLSDTGAILKIKQDEDGPDLLEITIPLEAVDYRPKIILSQEEKVKVIEKEIRPGDTLEGWKIVVEIPELTIEKLTPLSIRGIAVLDTEVRIGENHIIVVGGPCINKVAADILGVTYPACEEASEIPKDSAIIKVAQLGGKVAVLIAGWEWDDTLRASRAFAEYLITGEGLDGKKGEIEIS